MARIADCHQAHVPNVSKTGVVLDGEVVIKDYQCTPPVSIVWELDRTPITDYADVLRILNGPAMAQPLPCLGLFLTTDIDAAVASGVITLTGTI